MRIVSLLPSATEIVCALGGREDLVGRSSECDHPPSVTSLPALMRPRIDDREESSARIDERVRSVRGRGESLYELDQDGLRALRPDLLLTQDLCSVCSVTEAEVAEACRVSGIAPNVVSLSPRDLDGVWESVSTIGRAIGRADAGRTLTRGLRELSAGPGAAEADRARVAVVEWVDPPILAGLWVSEMVRAAGALTLGPPPAEVGARTTWAAIARQEPDLVVISPCSFSVERTRRELAPPEISRRVAELAPPLGTWVADEAFFSRPGPRLAHGIELLRRLTGGRGGRIAMPFERWIAPGVAA